MREQKPHLYFLLNRFTCLVKIGIAGHVPSRVQTLEHTNGVPLTLLGVAENLGSYEKQLHLAFGADRQLGEWFNPSPELLALASCPSYEAIRTLLRDRAEEVKRQASLIEERQRQRALEIYEAAAEAKAEAKRLKEEARRQLREAEDRREAARQRRAQKERESIEREQAIWRERNVALLQGRSLVDPAAIAHAAERLAKAEGGKGG